MLEKSILGKTISRGIIPHKVIIDIDNEGGFTNGLILYDVMENGVILKKNNSISIKSQISIPIINGMLQKFLLIAGKAEGLVDD